MKPNIRQSLACTGIILVLFMFAVAELVKRPAEPEVEESGGDDDSGDDDSGQFDHLDRLPRSEPEGASE